MLPHPSQRKEPGYLPPAKQLSSRREVASAASAGPDGGQDPPAELQAEISRLEHKLEQGRKDQRKVSSTGWSKRGEKSVRGSRSKS